MTGIGAKLPAKDDPFYTQAFSNATFVEGAKSTNTTKLTVTLTDCVGKTPQKGACKLTAYFATDATGQTLATAPTGNVSIAAKGVILNNVGSGQVLEIVTDSSGVFDLNVVNSGSVSIFMILCLPDGSILASQALAF